MRSGYFFFCLEFLFVTGKRKIAHLNPKFKSFFSVWYCTCLLIPKPWAKNVVMKWKKKSSFFCLYCVWLQTRRAMDLEPGFIFVTIFTRLLFHMFYDDPVPLHLIICLNYGLMTISNNQGIYAKAERMNEKRKNKVNKVETHFEERIFFFGALFRTLAISKGQTFSFKGAYNSNGWKQFSVMGFCCLCGISAAVEVAVMAQKREPCRPLTHTHFPSTYFFLPFAFAMLNEFSTLLDWCNAQSMVCKSEIFTAFYWHSYVCARNATIFSSTLHWSQQQNIK